MNSKHQFCSFEKFISSKILFRNSNLSPTSLTSFFGSIETADDDAEDKDVKDSVP
jgi:hypothetical protein